MVIRYFKNIFIWIDIGFNVLLLSGSPYETISSRIGKQAAKGHRWAAVTCKLIDAILGKEHCRNSEVPDLDKSLQWWKRIL